MLNRILAASGILGALTAVALIGYSSIEASAGDVPATITDPSEELTGPRAVCFATCAQSVWPEIAVLGIVEFQLWRGSRPDGGGARSVLGYVTERITTHENVFTALDVAGGVSGSCPVVHVDDQATYCVKRGADIFNDAQVACVRTCAIAIEPAVQTVERIALLAGPPRTIEITRATDLTPHEYTACRAAGICQAGAGE